MSRMTYKVLFSLIPGLFAWKKMLSTYPKFAKLQAKMPHLMNKLCGDTEATNMPKAAVLQRLKSTQRRLSYPCFANKIFTENGGNLLQFAPMSFS